MLIGGVMSRDIATIFSLSKMINVCATAILMSAAMIVTFSAVAGEKAKPDSNRTPQVQKLSFDLQLAIAIQQVKEFENKMREADPKAAYKIQRLRYAMPDLAGTFPPEQWRKQVEFLYASITMIDEMSSQADPDAVLSKYYSDEEKLAPKSAFELPDKERQTSFDHRLGELIKLLDSGMDTTEHAARQLASALIYYPNDQAFIAMLRYKFNLALQLKQGVIDREKFDMLWSIRRNSYFDNRNQQNIQEQATRDSQELKENQLRWASIFGGMADGIRNSQPAPSVNCRSSAMGGVVNTTCR